MEKRTDEIAELYGNRLRVRVSGLCVVENELLLVNHRGLNAENEFWSPPGGGMELGTSSGENLAREFREETGLTINMERFIGVHEFLALPLHAVELFFTVSIAGGRLRKGADPEMRGEKQIIKEVAFKSWPWIKTQPQGAIHNFLYSADSLEDLLAGRGYICHKKEG